MNAYNAFLYLAALAATSEMAEASGEAAFAATCAAAVVDGASALDKLLWVDGDERPSVAPAGGFWAAAWCENGRGARQQNVSALQAGALYGQMWASVLNLTSRIPVPLQRVRSHLLAERRRNARPFGLAFATNRSAPMDYYNGACLSDAAGRERAEPPQPSDRRRGALTESGLGVGLTDHDAWAEHSMVHAALGISVGAGSSSESLHVATTLLESYRSVLNDQWDYRDATSCYEDSSDLWGLRPVVNSHYSRQTIFWAIPLALTGQHFDARSRTLTLAPDPMLTDSFPVLLPSGSALFTRTAALCYHVAVLFGLSDRFAEMSVTVDGVQHAWQHGSVAAQHDDEDSATPTLLCPQ